LQAAAEGTSDRRLARHLRDLAQRIDRGESLEQILTTGSSLPPHLAGLLHASLSTNKPSFAIAEWLFARQQAHSHWRSVMMVLAYPLATLVATYALYVYFALRLLPDFSSLLEGLEFGVKFPSGVLAFFRFNMSAAPISLWVLAGLAVVLLLVRLLGGRRGWSRFMTALPIFGPLWHWSSSSELYRALAILLDNQIPLPEALRLTGDGISDAALAAHCRWLATRVEQGSELHRAMRASPELPASTFPLIRSGEQAGTLVASLRTAAEMLDSRLQAHASIIMQLMPTVVFLLVLCLVGMMLAGFVFAMNAMLRWLW
jgi:type II secretory pathway component PulF